jgi:hypothetical protein
MKIKSNQSSGLTMSTRLYILKMTKTQLLGEKVVEKSRVALFLLYTDCREPVSICVHFTYV